MKSWQVVIQNVEAMKYVGAKGLSLQTSPNIYTINRDNSSVDLVHMRLEIRSFFRN